MVSLQRNLNILLILILSGVLLGAFSVQIFFHEEPCPLCMLQRMGMLGVATGALMNLSFGINPKHYGLILLSSIFGGFVALRQITLHVCPGLPAYGSPVLGLSLYTWSFFIFTCCILGTAVLLLLYDTKQGEEDQLEGRWLGKLAFLIIFLIAFANIFTTYMQCGFGPCGD